MQKDAGLRNLFHTHLRRYHWQTIELGLAIAGVPDSNYCVDKIEGWVEFKKTEHWKVLIKPAQIGWIIRRCEAGGRVTVAVRRQAKGPRTVTADELYLFDGRLIEQLNDEGIRGTLGIGSWEGGPRNWNWELIDVILRRKPHGLSPRLRAA